MSETEAGIMDHFWAISDSEAAGGKKVPRSSAPEVLQLNLSEATSLSLWFVNVSLLVSFSVSLLWTGWLVQGVTLPF